MNTSSDAQLVAAISDRDEAALAEAYDRHGNAIFGLTWRVLRSKEHAEDLVQEVFLRLWRQPERFDASRGSLQSFLLADAHWRAVDLVRSESSRARREMRAAGAVADSRNDPEAALVAYDAAKPVLAALATLTMDERRAIHLAYFGGFTYVEVAQLLGQPEGTVKSRIRAGLQRMRAELTDATEGDQ